MLHDRWTRCLASDGPLNDSCLAMIGMESVLGVEIPETANGKCYGLKTTNEEKRILASPAKAGEDKEWGSASTSNVTKLG